MAKHMLGVKSIAAGAALILAATGSAYAKKNLKFDMVVSAGGKTCLPDATARVRVIPHGTFEEIIVIASGLPKKTDFAFFVLQTPTAPFGLSWYQGDIKSSSDGEAVGHFSGRFSLGTFVIAPSVAPAPQTFVEPPFPDAIQNPATLGPDGHTAGPVQMYHLGLWFNSPSDAAKLGCPSTVTPFNSTHNAGIQLLNTTNFPVTAGPLSMLNE
jgi:hypothetical protein